MNSAETFEMSKKIRLALIGSLEKTVKDLRAQDGPFSLRLCISDIRNRLASELRQDILANGGRYEPIQWSH